ncbi:hypothetical protein [Lentibacillus amyloliquefaciens]|uniref:Uncharacterized protein n=1 Tax=Lentibacillus amyloliquefaciens TaxID=1472767 RepID=A0A0U4FPI7_9BACI|nr:hypothetical protein [Lentibacillus amyloliquefaciens]ALX47765.1 hypothetical protein AOX59_03570 [Lentibacillus amyloliquefaciens]
MKNKTKSMGIELAREIVKHNKKVDEMISHKTYEFDVWKEEGKACVQTAICNVGGCAAHYLTFSSLDKAKRQASIMTILGEKMQTVGICNECLNDGADDDCCSHCGGDKTPVYDEFPDWLKFCPECDKYVD